MKTLLLLRHAKSDWSNAGLSDHDRPLNTRGKKAAPLMARFIKDQDLLPDIVRSSSSKRTRQTLQALEPYLEESCDVGFNQTLYHASEPEILRDIVALPETASTALYVGHNPGMHDLALRLTDSADKKDDYANLRHKFPTAGLAVLTFDCDDWHDVGFGTGHLRLVVYPKMLPEI